MSGLSFLGSYSGIDSSVVEQLIEAEAAKKVQYTNKIDQFKSEKNAWNDINTRLDNLFKKLEVLQKQETFTSSKVSHEDEGLFGVTTETTAQPAEYRLHIKQLAASSRLTGQKVTALSDRKLTDALGIAGSFDLVNNEEVSTTIEIAAEDSMKDILAKINGKTEETGIKATLVDNRLVLTDTAMGERTITVEGDAAAGLGFAGTPEELTKGQSAVFLIDGFEVERDTNKISDVIEGVTFDLKNVHVDSASTVVKVESDVEKTTKAVKEFVEQYNSTMSFIKSQLDVGDPTAEDNKTGALAGDSMLMRVQSGLRNLLTKPVEEINDSTVKSIKDLGIGVDRYGVASLDEAAFHKALEANSMDVRNYFYQQQTVQTSETDTDGEPIVSSKFVRTGLAENLREFIDSFISGTTGLIKTKSETYDRMVKDMNERVDAFNERLEAKRIRLIKQFTALDTAMMQAESQMSYMFSQLGMDSGQQ